MSIDTSSNFSYVLFERISEARFKNQRKPFQTLSQFRHDFAIRYGYKSWAELQNDLLNNKPVG